MNSEERMQIVRRVVKQALDTFEKTEQYEAVLLCEGDENSIDVALYRAVYPHLLVIPTGGCSHITTLINSIRKRLPCIQVFGIIDRDSLSKSEVRGYKEENGIYCTKLPFIENIIACPEILRILCDVRTCDYDEGVDMVRKRLMRNLSQKLRSALPINIGMPNDECVASITIKIRGTDGSFVEKTVNESNIIYAYRDKAVANESADILGIIGRERYYTLVKKSLGIPVIGHKLVQRASSYLPLIKVEPPKKEV